jgi:hypothetical protein
VRLTTTQQCCFKLRSGINLARFNLSETRKFDATEASNVRLCRCLLRFEPKARAALLLSADPVISNQFWSGRYYV